LDYLQWFPNAALTWSQSPTSTFNLAYGRRINRPDYNVLNPFNNRLSELSYQKGNPRLNPEIVNNLELGWTWQYRYNFKLAYSKTDDQITRIMAPDVRLDENGNPIGDDTGGDIRAGFISWDNLATQKIYSFSSSLPLQVNKFWSAYINLSANYQDNQADYGEGRTIDLQAFSYNIYQQHTFELGKGWKGEISGWFSGPGIWGGVFLYDESWSLNVGLQRKFFNDQLQIRVNAEDIFYQTGWNGKSNFAGLFSEGRGNWDSRRVGISLSYNFGNQNVKSRKRNTGLEDEAGRVGS
jgi:outer membrane receptor protein involved in Fe transport